VVHASGTGRRVDGSDNGMIAYKVAVGTVMALLALDVAVVIAALSV
jgi:hypothetical protein